MGINYGNRSIVEKFGKLNTKELLRNKVRNVQTKKDISIFNFVNSQEDFNINFNSVNNIPEGISKYKYKGARVDIHKDRGYYKSQFVYPRNYNIEEFVDKFPNLDNLPILDVQPNMKSSIRNSVNSLIDEPVSQSTLTGDCWLISGVISMANNEIGRDIIKNSITVNNNGSVNVSFKGIGVSYNISAEEIEIYDTDLISYDKYSNGDNDMLAIELAVEKLWTDIENGKVNINTDNENINFSGNGSGIQIGGFPSQILYYLTGIESEEYYNDVSGLSQKQIYSILNDALNNPNTVINVGIYDNIHSCKLTDDTIYAIDLGSGGHALAITNVTPNTVTFVNPWDTSVEYTASWKEFASLKIGYVASANLSNSTVIENIEPEEEIIEPIYDNSETIEEEVIPIYDDTNIKPDISFDFDYNHNIFDNNYYYKFYKDKFYREDFDRESKRKYYSDYKQFYKKIVKKIIKKIVNMFRFNIKNSIKYNDN